MPTNHPVAVPDFIYGTAWKEGQTAALTELALRTCFRLRLDRLRYRSLGRNGKGAGCRAHASARREQRFAAAPHANDGRPLRDSCVRSESLLRPARLGSRCAIVLQR